MQLSLIFLSIFAALSTVQLKPLLQLGQGKKNLNLLKSSSNLLQKNDRWSPKSCSLALQGIVYAPENGIENYFNRVFDYFEVNRELMFLAPQNISVIQNFIATYRMNVSIHDAFGINGLTFFLPVGSVIDAIPIKYRNTIRASINLSGFSIGRNGIAYDSRVIRNSKGELKYVTLSLALANSPQFCL